MPHSPPSQSSGRRRDPDIDSAVISATLELLDEVGYTDLSIGQVAKRAEVYRPALYRRWPSKHHLVTDAIATTIGTAPTPDSGDVRQDLVAGVMTVVEAFDEPTLGHVLLPVVVGLAAHPDLRREFLDRVFAPWRETTREVLSHAVTRGDVRPDIDMEFTLDALVAPVYLRALFQHAPLDRVVVEQTVDLVLSDITA